jgi:DNA-binding CsgD family transcriptional regulator
MQNLLNKCNTKPQLSDRQLDCLYYLVKGMTIKEIAKEMSLSPRTVEHYLEAIKIKLNSHSRVDLFEKAMCMKIIRERIILH